MKLDKGEGEMQPTNPLPAKACFTPSAAMIADFHLLRWSRSALSDNKGNKNAFDREQIRKKCSTLLLTWWERTKGTTRLSTRQLPFVSGVKEKRDAVDDSHPFVFTASRQGEE